MNDTLSAGIATPAEMTIFNTIADLKKLSWRLNGLVFGEVPTAENTGTEPQPADKLTYARNEIMSVNSRLREIADRLEIIGK